MNQAVEKKIINNFENDNHRFLIVDYKIVSLVLINKSKLNILPNR